MKKTLIKLLFISFISGLSSLVTAQSIPSDLSQVNVDDLSSGQIEQLVQKAQSSGFTVEQLEIMAKARGMSSIEIAKLRSRINTLGVNASQGNQEAINRLREQGSTNPIDNSALFDALTQRAFLESEKSKVFGLELFRTSSLTFEPSQNIPTPDNYVLGTGDELIVDIWGASEQTYQLQISPEGSVRLPTLGPVYVNGLTVSRARTRLKNKLVQIYSGISPRDGSAPNTFYDISLGTLKSIKVNVIGEVELPGTYTLSSLSTAFNALYYAGGPTQKGSLRRIEVFRSGQLLSELDIYEYLVQGKHDNNIGLKNEDIIRVRPYESRITITGDVKTTGVFEAKQGETLQDMLGYAGGFNALAYKASLTVLRNEEKEKSIQTVYSDQFTSFKLQSGDVIKVGRIIEKYSNLVEIRGAVYRKGNYELTAGLTLSELIEKADGIKGDAFLGRGLLLRTNEDLSLSTLEFNVKNVLDGEEDIVLIKDDYVLISSIYDLEEEQYLNVQGEVLNPGKFPFSEGMTVKDLIYLAGGLKESASGSNIEIARRLGSSNSSLALKSEVFTIDIEKDLTLSKNDPAFSLQPFDLVLVRRSPGYEAQALIKIEGEVVYPGNYALERKNERISDLIKRSGGLTGYAYIKGATLIRRTEFFLGGDNTKVATKLRARELREFGQRDSLISKIKNKDQESIGINLEEILDNPGSKYDLILEEGDIISVPQQFQTVRMRGELLYPATVRYEKIQSFKDYITQAGGFADGAKPGKTYVIYANGAAARTKRFLWFKNYPKVEPGAEIIVPKKREGRRLSIQELLAITTTLTTMALLIDRLGN